MAAAALKTWPAVGLSIAVVRGGGGRGGRDTIVLKGYGQADLEHDIRATARTVYRIGSITKQFTAVAVLQLAEQGKLALADTIQKFLPDFPAQGHRVTVRHLLTHTSGIKSYTSLGPEWQDKMRLDLTHEQLVALFRDKPFDFEPGTRFLYDNSGYFLLGMIIERVSGQSYADYLKQSILKPLGPLQVRVFEAGGKLRAQATGQTAFGLRWQGDSTFLAAFDDNVRLVFRPALGPRATSFVLFQGGAVQTATRVE